MNKELKFHERILANLNAELMYCIAKGDREQCELLKLRIAKQKELIDGYLQTNKQSRAI